MLQIDRVLNEKRLIMESSKRTSKRHHHTADVNPTKNVETSPEETHQEIRWEMPIPLIGPLQVIDRNIAEIEIAHSAHRLLGAMN